MAACLQAAAWAAWVAWTSKSGPQHSAETSEPRWKHRGFSLACVFDAQVEHPYITLMGVSLLILGAIALLLLAVVALRLSNPVPSLANRTSSTALAADSTTPLGQSIAPQLAEYADLSGIHIVSKGQDALGVRRHLAHIASRCIDAQYYIWSGDLTGRLMLHDMLAAADRGVRVRLLLDDNPTIGLDDMWSAVNLHPNIEVRLFNPFTIRKPRSFNYLTDFSRINRRMHNKAFIVDGLAAVVGGRNIGDEYFEAAEGMQFADMDVVAVGEVVADLSRDFDRYWSCASAFPAEFILRAPPDSALVQLRDELQRLVASEEASSFGAHAAESPLIKQLLAGKLDLDWAPVELFSDAPAKGKGQVPRKKLVISGLVRALGEARTSLEVATAYFVPGRFGNGYLRRRAQAGVAVTVLTNSLASTDVAAVHAGYAKYRRRLLRANVRLFEMRPQIAAGEDNPAKFPRLGSSKSSLHAKLFIIDRKSLFIGSFNFDPRSVYLNCEMGLLIHSEKLGQLVGKQFDVLAGRASFEPRLGRFGKLRWFDHSSTEPIAIEKEPESSFRQRMTVRIVSLLPVEWLL